jgi:hypothetical protein
MTLTVSVSCTYLYRGYTSTSVADNVAVSRFFIGVKENDEMIKGKFM